MDSQALAIVPGTALDLDGTNLVQKKQSSARDRVRGRWAFENAVKAKSAAIRNGTQFSTIDIKPVAEPIIVPVNRRITAISNEAAVLQAQISLGIFMLKDVYTAYGSDNGAWRDHVGKRLPVGVRPRRSLRQRVLRK